MSNSRGRPPVNVNELLKDIQELGVDMSVDNDEVQLELNSVTESNEIILTSTSQSHDIIDDDDMIKPLTNNNFPIRDLSHYINQNDTDEINSSDDDEEATDQDNDDDDDSNEVEENFNPYVPLQDVNNFDNEEFSEFIDANSKSALYSQEDHNQINPNSSENNSNLNTDSIEKSKPSIAPLSQDKIKHYQDDNVRN